jgi:hypothetical protein
MNKLIPLILALIMSSCTTKKSSEVNETFNPKAEVIDKNKKVILSEIKNQYEVNVGQQLTYTASIHGSVGYTCEVYSSDENIVKFIDKKHEYDNPANSNMSGGDAATNTYTFEAIESGETSINVIKYFRGDIENSYELKITVK